MMNHTQTPSTAPADRARHARRDGSPISTLPGAPLRPRSCLDQGTRSPTTEAELGSLRAAAWHRHGVAALAIHDIADPWLRQAVINEATRRWGPRNERQTNGR